MTDFVTAPDGVRIAYESVGKGPAILLIHGFASDRVTNWRGVGWYDALTGAGYRVVAFDNRGHGESDKPHDPQMYSQDKRVGDALAVMEAAGLSDAAVMGYSMGGYMSLQLLMENGPRVRRLAVGGVGETYFTDRGALEAMVIAAMEAPSLANIADPIGQMFRRFADQGGKDKKALAACMRGTRKLYSPSQLAAARQDVLIVCGGNDPLTGRPGPLAAAFPNGRAVTVERRDHNTVVGDKLYKQAVLDFLKQQD